MKRLFGQFVRLAATVAGAVLVLWLVGWMVRPELHERPLPYSPEEIREAKAARDVAFDPTDTESLPTVHVDVDYTQGPAAPWWPKNQSPVLDPLVADGTLPPVAERVGPEPIVMKGSDGIGEYGGTWHRIASGEDDVSVIGWRLSYAALFRFSPLGYPIEPHLAKSVDVSEDGRVFTVHLRRGVRWSDGAPFTADDIIYWWEREETDESVGDGRPPAWMRVGGGDGKIEKLDDHTVKFSWDKPNGQFKEMLASNSHLMLNSPRHFLSRYHPELGDPEFIAAEMKALRQPSPRSLYSNIKGNTNPEHPRLWPWIYRSYRSTAPQVFVRNPYYYVVDTEGNQLPYLDRVQFAVRGSQVLAMSFSNGDASMQARHVRVENYTELMKKREVAGTRVLLWYPGTRSTWVINPNLNRLVPEGDPVAAAKAKLLSDKRFRQALSLAINRDLIIRAEYNGQVRPSQVAPGPQSPFHSERLARAFTEYDPQRASAMLDELGLSRRDIDGMRTLPDGTPLSFHIDFTAFTGGGPAQFIVDDWAAVGIRAIPREQARTLFYTRKDSGDFDFKVWSSESDMFALLEPRYFLPHNTEAFYAVRWGRWYSNNGFYDPTVVERLKNAEAPPADHPIYQAFSLYEQALATTDEARKIELFSKVLDIAAENLWTIGIAEAPPQPVVVKQDFRNVPANAVFSARSMAPGNTGIETYFYVNAQSKDSPGLKAETEQQLRYITPRPRVGGSGVASTTPGMATAAQPTSSGFVGAFIRYGLMLVALGLLTMAAVRHPFVIRRLMVLVPTLLVISAVVFMIIQLPPGDFLTSRIVQLQETGDENAVRQLEELKQQFHFDDPVWMQYCRWMGVFWFASFDSKDAGLLQGSMGRSMENGQPVNNLVGDRILLTFLLSLGTILFTWAVAIPIGVYSAVRQYSLADYFLTLLGFVGMSVPSFLLALVLLSMAGLSAGLFSPEFAAQPEWDWPKIKDLLRHLWVPVIVLGIGGTAGMIRIMRANLLDELRKPYVTTARAKGVRPLKLLFKYPVRVALNPFVSGIGHIFPALISGGAIVSIVLSLPTVGPLLLNALFSQDMYLAGSMLMVLSLLGVLGTLFSDLLLLWLDPRIRYEGGSR